jgi:hypothetical protein
MVTVFNIARPGQHVDRMFARDFAVVDGALVMNDEDGHTMAAYAPGTWGVCLREDALRRIPEEGEEDFPPSARRTR